MCWQKTNDKGTLVTICNYKYGSEHCNETVMFQGKEISYKEI